MHRKIRITGAGCVRADRYGTFEVGGREVWPLLLQAMRESCGTEEVCLAGRLTLTLEIWQHPLTVRGGAPREEESV